jgi:hypothetical protein
MDLPPSLDKFITPSSGLPSKESLDYLYGRDGPAFDTFSVQSQGTKGRTSLQAHFRKKFYPGYSQNAAKEASQVYFVGRFTDFR